MTADPTPGPKPRENDHEFVVSSRTEHLNHIILHGVRRLELVATFGNNLAMKGSETIIAG